jgi:ferredoxin-NADP reductase
VTIHTYLSQRDLADTMPLVTESATVTAVEPMDDVRSKEIRARVEQLSDSHGLALQTKEEGSIDWPSAIETAAETSPTLVSQLGALHERYERDHPALVRIELETDEPFEFVAGQYVTIRYRGRSRPYSLASSPTREKADLCVRRVPEGRLSPLLSANLEIGDQLTVRGPNGHLHLEDPSERDIAFVATGTGVAPLKSMLDYLFDTERDVYRGEPRDVWLFLGAAWADDLPYHAAFRAFDREKENFHYVPCVSREPWLGDWDGETEYVQDALVKYVDEASLGDAAFGRHIARYLGQRPASEIDARIDPHRLEVYACGLNGMVFGLETTVKRIGVPERHIHGEGYG